MMQGRADKVRAVALVGVESTGKSTLAQLLVGRLKTRGVRAALAAEPGVTLPFPPAVLDTCELAHAHVLTRKMADESAVALRTNVEFVVSDRTPLDLLAYYLVKFPQGTWLESLTRLAWDWARQYDALYYLPAEGTVYVEDGFRAPLAENHWRAAVDALLGVWAARRDGLPWHAVAGAQRARCEFVYHHILSEFFGDTRPLRAYEQVRAWLTGRGWRIKEVRPQGSNSVMRFHPASDHDDIDAMVVVDGDVLYAQQVYADFKAHQDHLENVVQASLDLLITPAGLEAYEA